MNDFETEGVWLWDEDNSPATWTHWNTGEPNNFASGEQCVGMIPVLWNDLDCEDLHSFWCQQPSGEYDV